MKNSLGKIISINKDLYSVLCGTEVFPCSVRGKLKNIKLTVGDNVKFDKDNKTINLKKGINDRIKVLSMLDIYTSDKQIVLSKYTELNEIDEHLLYLLKAFKNNHLDLIVTSSSDVIASTTNRISKHDVITEEFLNLFLKDGSISLTPSNQISLTKQVKFEKYIFGRKLLKLGDLKAVIILISEEPLMKSELEIIDVISSYLSSYF